MNTSGQFLPASHPASTSPSARIDHHLPRHVVDGSLGHLARGRVGGVALTQALTSVSAADASAHTQVQKALDRAVADGAAPGMVAEVRDRRGRWFGSAGVSCNWRPKDG